MYSRTISLPDCVDVLCGCGWGRLNVPESEAPATCPLCGHVFVDPLDAEIYPEIDDTDYDCRACGATFYAEDLEVGMTCACGGTIRSRISS